MKKGCSHLLSIKYGKTKKGLQRRKCKLCGMTYTSEPITSDEEIFRQIIDIANDLENKLVIKCTRFDYTYDENGDEFPDFANEYEVNQNQPISIKKFNSMLKKEKIESPLVIFYMTKTDGYLRQKMNIVKVHVGNK